MAQVRGGPAKQLAHQTSREGRTTFPRLRKDCQVEEGC